MIADLHCHSKASDGELEPAALWAMAQQSGIELLALTDHDTIEGSLALRDLAAAYNENGCRLVSGVEISTVWNKHGIHIIGLDFDLDAELMRQALSGQQRRRRERAQRIDSKLQRQGIEGAYAGALAIAGDAAPCRPHFARWLVAQGHCEDGAQAFTRFLGNKKMVGLNHEWPQLAQAVRWIIDAGGVPVLAHPEDYRLTRSKLRRLLADFADAGGRAMELAAPGKQANTALMIETLCRESGMAASVGSDYHNADQRWRRLGRTRPIPAGLQPVWELFQ